MDKKLHYRQSDSSLYIAAECVLEAGWFWGRSREHYVSQCLSIDNWPIIKKKFQDEKFKGNDLSTSTEIYISENDTETPENCTLVFPK